MKETANLCDGLIRIGVSEAGLVGWDDFLKLSGIAPEHARALKKVAQSVGSDCRDWKASFEPVPRSLWAEVQKYLDHAWVAIDVPEPEPPIIT
jgi:hypothetical protein